MRTVIEVVLIVVAAFAIAMLVQFFVVKPFTIHQVSMEPTIVDGERVLVNRFIYHFRDPKVGEVVVFHSPARGEDLVKRVVGVAGDRVEVKDGALYVNGERRIEPYLNEQTIQGVFLEITVPRGTVFVMGDNRNNSLDSRIFGPVGKKSILGRAFVIYWPISRWSGLSTLDSPRLRAWEAPALGCKPWPYALKSAGFTGTWLVEMTWD
jgi:signal peptidase I